MIKEFYLKLRVKHRSVDATPVTTRQLESLLRLTQVGSTIYNCFEEFRSHFCSDCKARAKLELREIATEGDANDVLELFKFGMAGILEDDHVVGTALSQLVNNTGSVRTGRSQTKATVKHSLKIDIL